MYHSGNSIQCSVVTSMEKKSKKEWIYVHRQLIHSAVHQKFTQHCKETTSIKYSKESTWGLEAEPGRKSYKCSAAAVSGLSTPTTEVFAKDVFRSWTIAAQADGGELEIFVIFTVYIMQISMCMLILCGLQRIISCIHLLHLSVLDRNTVIFFHPP